MIVTWKTPGGKPKFDSPQIVRPRSRASNAQPTTAGHRLRSGQRKTGGESMTHMF